MVLMYATELFRDDNGTIRVEFPDVPEANSFGDTEDEALAQARDALETALELRLQLYQSMRDQNVNRAELARRLGWHYPQVVRLFDFEHASHVEQLEAALAAVGRSVVVETTPSKVLEAVIGSNTMPRTEVTRKIWDYIKRNGLVPKSLPVARSSVSKRSRRSAATSLTKSPARRVRQKAAARKSRRV
jgi:antitoxin HicB